MMKIFRHDKAFLDDNERSPTSQQALSALIDTTVPVELLSININSNTWGGIAMLEVHCTPEPPHGVRLLLACRPLGP